MKTILTIRYNLDRHQRAQVLVGVLVRIEVLGETPAGEVPEIRIDIFSVGRTLTITRHPNLICSLVLVRFQLFDVGFQVFRHFLRQFGAVVVVFWYPTVDLQENR